ncbi:NAD(P)/FAD-dependent oxidoreductase [Singulisphaera sp. Ch08]|uniref:NAD(P)/FAD-dependent oxidoreductase n=1 Tax=Singulisphaera sp. Ch08 TaxID=3120278 RepID=A0AAU7CF57_9BACT
MGDDSIYDLIVVGGGMGGLATAALVQRFGLRVALLEAHTKLGGCAGYFGRECFTFDAGATALMGLNPGEPIGDLLTTLGVDLPTASTPGYRVHLPDRSFELGTEPGQFERESSSVFPDHPRAGRAFWRLQEAVGGTLFRAAGQIPRMPVARVADLWHDLRILGLSGVLAGTLAFMTVQDVLRLFRLDRDRSFRSLIAMLLQDTAQAGPESVPFANAAACLQAYRLGLRRPLGGMKRLVEGIGHRLGELGGDLRTACLVDAIDRQGPGEFAVVTRRRERLRTRQVAMNLPLDIAARLLGRPLTGSLGRSERQSRPAWSAFTGYLAIARERIPDDSPLFHHVLQSYDAPTHDGNNVLISLSAPDDEGYGPSDVRVATLSTHTEPVSWTSLDRAAYAAKKADYRRRLLGALETALPGASGALVHEEFATPRSFARYTRRSEGAVGGAPMSRWNSNFLSVGSDLLGPGLWVVGDSVFPGQGTMATVLSAIRVVERITGIRWEKSRSQYGGGKSDSLGQSERTEIRRRGG